MFQLKQVNPGSIDEVARRNSASPAGDRSCSHTATLTSELDPSPTIVPKTSGRRFLVLVYERDEVRVTELGPGDSLVIGRAPPSELLVGDPSLSRCHAKLTCNGLFILVEDLGSKNGTRVDGRAITRAEVNAGAEVVLGNVVVGVRHASSDPSLGFDDYDRFLVRLQDEVLRTRSFGRSLTLLMLRAQGTEHAQLHRWSMRVRAELRPVDAMTSYGPIAVLVLLPELPLSEGLQCAKALIRRRSGEPELRCGASSFPEATSAQELLETARSSCRKTRSDQPLVGFRVSAESRGTPSSAPIVCNQRMLELYRLLGKVALGSAPVLLLGETGTGKEVVAHRLHETGPRRGRPFKVMNCAAIPPTLMESVLFGHERGAFTSAHAASKGVFEEAQGGTLFLDEIGELSLQAQAALLRAVETKRIARLGSAREIALDVRLVAATHCDLDAMVANRTFRADLWHRLNLVTLTLPPLRTRQDEIEPLAERFLEQAREDWHSPVRAIAKDTLELLRAYSWPGNVRELRNVIERAVLVGAGDVIGIEHLPERLLEKAVCVGLPERAESNATPSAGLVEKVREYEVELIRDALQNSAGNQKRAALLLGVPLRTLEHKLKAYYLRKTDRDG